MATENYITKWLTEEERYTGYSFITSGGFFSLSEDIFILTDSRIIFLKRHYFEVDEVSDKLWCQLASFKLIKRPFSNSILRLRFFSSPCYNFKDMDCNLKDSPWEIQVSTDEYLMKVYQFIKEKEISHKKQRSSDHRYYNLHNSNSTHSSLLPPVESTKQVEEKQNRLE